MVRLSLKEWCLWLSVCFFTSVCFGTQYFDSVSVGDGAASAPSLFFSSDSNNGFFRPGADILGFSTNGTERVRITASGLVGIGTASPGSALHVVGKVTAGTFSGNGSLLTNLPATQLTGVTPIANGGTNSASALNNNRVMTSSGGSIVEGAAITASMALISDANGIPTHSGVTSSTLAFLDATSSVQTQLNAKANLASPTFTGTVSTGAIQDSSLIKFLTNSTERMRIQNGGVIVGTNGSSVTLPSSPALYVTDTAFAGTFAAIGTGAQATPTFTISGDTDTGWFSPAANQLGVSTNGIERMRFDSTGKVGIGTTTPGATLSVAGAVSAGTFVAAGTGSVGAPTFTISGNTNTGWFSPASNQVAISTAGTERWRIDAGGAVGVGTASPAASALFDIASSTRGFLPPRLTTTARDAIPSPSAGLLIYNLSTSALNLYTSSWTALASGASAGTINIITFTSGSGTYTPTSGLKYAIVSIAGGGAGGAGGGTSGNTNGAAGGNTTFGATLTANGGAAGRVGNDEGGAGGTCTVSSPATQILALTGGQGDGGQSNGTTGATTKGGRGGENLLGGGGAAPPAGLSDGHNGVANTGAGGSGGSTNGTSSDNSGSGGGSGCYIEAFFTSPSTSAVTIGTGGTGGVAGGNGNKGGNGAAGVVIIKEGF
jgi:hypothetical protein